MSQLALGFEPGSARLSDCGRYRYELTRQWAPEGPRCCWIMLNPSTADALADDPTIRRCMGFSRAWGFASLVVVNLFAWRATDPFELYALGGERIGPENDAAILAAVAGSARTVAAWGTHGALSARGTEVRKLLRPTAIHHLGLTVNGHPKHPLYLRADTAAEVWA